MPTYNRLRYLPTLEGLCRPDKTLSVGHCNSPTPTKNFVVNRDSGAPTTNDEVAPAQDGRQWHNCRSMQCSAGGVIRPILISRIRSNQHVHEASRLLPNSTAGDPCHHLPAG
ncbi:hypothetical protein AAHC03_010271 [Spirometra sp. Aus1]